MAKGSTTLAPQHGPSPTTSNLEEHGEYIRAARDSGDSRDSRDSRTSRSSPLPPWIIQEEYIDEETEALSNKGRKYLKELYNNYQKFKDEIIHFVEDKAELDREKFLDKRFKYNILNKLRMETLAKFALSKDHTKGLFEIIGQHIIL